jgi:hypothetical protein
MAAVVPSYKGFRYPVEVISHCVWLYYRFPLSFREVEEMMLERGALAGRSRAAPSRARSAEQSWNRSTTPCSGGSTMLPAGPATGPSHNVRVEATQRRLGRISQLGRSGTTVTAARAPRDVSTSAQDHGPRKPPCTSTTAAQHPPS